MDKETAPGEMTHGLVVIAGTDCCSFPCRGRAGVIRPSPDLDDLVLVSAEAAARGPGVFFFIIDNFSVRYRSAPVI